MRNDAVIGRRLGCAVVVGALAATLFGSMGTPAAAEPGGGGDAEFFGGLEQSARAQLVKWEQTEIAGALQAVREAIRGGPRALTPEERVAFTVAWGRQMKGWRDYGPGDDRFASRAGSQRVIVATLVWYVQCLLQRPSMTAERLAGIEAQIDDMARGIQEQIRRQQPQLDAKDVDAGVAELRSSLKAAARDVLIPSVKRPLSEAELKTFWERVPGVMGKSQEQLQSQITFWDGAAGVPRDKRLAEIERLKKSACARVFAVVTSCYQMATQPAPSRELTEAMDGLNKEYAKGSRQWAEEQQQKGEERFVTGLVGATFGQVEETLMLLEIPFMIRPMVDDGRPLIFW